jgi:3'5'-cyclic nucleotide phosphodiesterase
MESTGKADLIQVSQKTADLLLEAGKGHWLAAREDLVDAKGKGMLQTYFVDPPSAKAISRSDYGGGSASDAMNATDDVLHVMGLVSSAGNSSAARLERLIEWNVDTMKYLVKNIVARRQILTKAKPPVEESARPETSSRNMQPRSEVTEVITLPEFDFKVPNRIEAADVELSEEVLWQIRDLVSVIGYMYRRNPFHNFEHASHVVMSTMKLLERVVSPEVYLSSVSRNRKKVAEEVASNLHRSTFGITSDPLTQFAIVFAALVHDVDHGGVSNQQLVAENSPLARKFDNLSPAEQHSVCIAWELILRPAYKELRDCLFSSTDDLNRFRQLLVNSVMATDIFDPELKRMRESRWGKAFEVDADPSGPSSQGTASQEDLNRKATIVIEHLIQASDVSHTMQHWTLYIKWNKRLFEELYLAYRSGRSPKNPADGWYQGELWFFDNYVVRLVEGFWANEMLVVVSLTPQRSLSLSPLFVLRSRWRRSCASAAFSGSRATSSWTTPPTTGRSGRPRARNWCSRCFARPRTKSRTAKS